MVAIAHRVFWAPHSFQDTRKIWCISGGSFRLAKPGIDCGTYLGGLELSPAGSRLRLCCVLATRWVHSCSSSAPEAPDRVCVDLHIARAFMHSCYDQREQRCIDLWDISRPVDISYDSVFFCLTKNWPASK